MPVKKRNIIPVFFLLFTKGNRESVKQATLAGINLSLQDIEVNKLIKNFKEKIPP